MTGPIRVAVLGARGRMGSTVCRAVDAAPDLVLVAAGVTGVCGQDTQVPVRLRRDRPVHGLVVGREPGRVRGRQRGRCRP
ncbi:MAG: hypothetical protein ACHQE5_12240, partial [Actinomycetes bacterium]